MSWFQPKLFLYSQNLSLVYLILESWYQTGITYDSCKLHLFLFIIASDEAKKHIFLRNIFMLIPTLYESFALLFAKSVESCLSNHSIKLNTYVLPCVAHDPCFYWQPLSNTANVTTAWVLILLCCRIVSLLSNLLAQSTHLLGFWSVSQTDLLSYFKTFKIPWEWKW